MKRVVITMFTKHLLLSDEDMQHEGWRYYLERGDSFDVSDFISTYDLQEFQIDNWLTVYRDHAQLPSPDKDVAGKRWVTEVGYDYQENPFEFRARTCKTVIEGR